MSKARLVITAIEVEGRSPAEVVAAYGVSRSWLYEQLARYRAEGDAAFEPRSRRPHTSPQATPAPTVELVLRLRKQLGEAGLDAGADTLGWHLTQHHRITLSRATIHRILARHGAVVPDPAKRPKSSYLRFAAEQPNETWQSDFTHYRLTTGADTEIITWLDDHSRLALHVSAHRRITGPIVLATFGQATEETPSAVSLGRVRRVLWPTAFEPARVPSIAAPAAGPPRERMPGSAPVALRSRPADDSG